jgi:hypothetical protein
VVRNARRQGSQDDDFCYPQTLKPRSARQPGLWFARDRHRKFRICASRSARRALGSDRRRRPSAW